MGWLVTEIMNRFFTLLLAASCLTAVGQVPNYVPTDGLVGWWAFDGNAQDESGNDIDLTEVGSVEYVSDRFGNAISAIGFGGGATESRVQFPNFSLIDGWNQGTLSFWVNVVEHNVTGHYFGFDNMFSVRQRHGVNTQFMLGLLGGTTRVRIHLDGGLPNSGDLVSEQALVVGQWHLVTMTFNGSQGFQNIYIDGQLSGSLSSSAMLSSMGSPDMFAFGFYGGVGSGSCNSIMDEVGLWNRALDALEVESLFATMAHIEGCIDTSACNFNAEATVDDGSCIPSGCLDANACNFNSLAQCEGESCDYSCCPGPGCCGLGMHWDWNLGECAITNPSDSNFDGCVQLNDLLDLLSAYSDCGSEESAWQCGDPLEYQGYDYETVQIGEQCWFAENCRFLPEVYSSENGSDTIPRAYVLNYDGEDLGVAASLEEYLLGGALYNYPATSFWDLCPADWHVGNDFDWDVLESFASLPDSLADQLGWRGAHAADLKSTQWDGNDSLGFTIIAHGYRDIHPSDTFWGEVGNSAAFWAGEHTRFFQTDFQGVLRGIEEPSYGFSVRCIKD